MLTPGFFLTLLNCMEGFFVILKLRRKAEMLIFLYYMYPPDRIDSILLSSLTGICCSAIQYMPEFIKFHWNYVLQFLYQLIQLSRPIHTVGCVGSKSNNYCKIHCGIILNRNIWLSHNTPHDLFMLYSNMFISFKMISPIAGVVILTQKLVQIKISTGSNSPSLLPDKAFLY